MIIIHHCRVISELVFDEDLESRVVKTKMMHGIDAPMKCNSDREDGVALCPLYLLPHVLNLGTRFLLSGGELSHP